VCVCVCVCVCMCVCVCVLQTRVHTCVYVSMYVSHGHLCPTRSYELVLTLVHHVPHTCTYIQYRQQYHDAL